MKRFAVLSLLLLCAACGGSSASAPTKTGTTGSSSGSTQDGGSAVAFLAPATDCSGAGLGSLTGLLIGVTDHPVADACRLASDHCVDAKNLTSVNIAILNQADPGPAALPPPGTYDLGNLPQGITLEAYVVTSDATCNKTPVKATSGAVTLKAVGAQEVAGTFELGLEDGRSVHGSFDTPVCGDTMAGAPICQFASGQSVQCTGARTCQ